MKKRIVSSFVTGRRNGFAGFYIIGGGADSERVKTTPNKKDNHEADKYIVVLEANV